MASGLTSPSLREGIGEPRSAVTARGYLHPPLWWRAASWRPGPGGRDDLVHAGGIWRDDPVVYDRNWISSRGPRDLAMFIPAMIAHFRGVAPPGTDAQEGVVESSPAHDQPFALAVRAARLMPGAATAVLACAMLGTSLVEAFARCATS
jgi:hypothetical protein